MKKKIADEMREWLADALGANPDDTAALVEHLSRLRKKSGLFNERAMKMIEGVLRMGEWRVRDVMIARNDIIGVQEDDDFERAVARVCEWQHSRYPVFSRDRDRVLGILLAKDLLHHAAAPDKFCLRDAMRKAVFVPLTQRLDLLLDEFRNRRSHLFVAVDEYQMPAGIVTIEDALEKIVGEIEDESDDDDDRVAQKTPDGGALLKGAMSVEEFNAEMNAELPADGADTMAGWLAAELGHIPQKGETHRAGGFVFEVAAADDRRVLQLKAAPEKEGGG